MANIKLFTFKFNMLNYPIKARKEMLEHDLLPQLSFLQTQLSLEEWLKSSLQVNQQLQLTAQLSWLQSFLQVSQQLQDTYILSCLKSFLQISQLLQDTAILSWLQSFLQTSQCFSSPHFHILLHGMVNSYKFLLLFLVINYIFTVFTILNEILSMFRITVV